MSVEPSRLGRFLSELKRRHVVRAVLAYAAVGFVALQAAEIVQGAFALPSWALRAVVVFTLLGFPLVTALAWVYEITPHGLRTMREIDAEAGIPDAGSVLPRLALLFVTVLAVGASGWWWLGATLAEGEAGAPPSADRDFRPASDTEGDGAVRSLAVLRFESFSESGGEDYFALGMQEALTSQLSQLGFVRVVSRTSVMQYDATGRSVPRIGEDLGVDAVVEGSVLRADGRVRITVQLIHAATDRHLWAQDYERDLVDVIALQREVAAAIAEEIRGELGAPAGAEMPIAETTLPGDAVATEEVMKGRMALSDPTGGSLDSAAVHFTRALARDSAFAPGWLGMAQVHFARGLEATTPDPEELEAAERVATRALELEPASREAREILVHIGALRGGLPGVGERRGAPTTGRVGRGPVGPVGPIDAPEIPDWIPALTEAGRQVQVMVALKEASQAGGTARLRAARRLSSSGLHEQARALLEDVVEDEPGLEPAWDELESTLVRLGDLERLVEAREERSRRSDTPAGPSLGELTRALAARGVQGYWSWRLDELEARKAAGLEVPPMEEARAQAALGRRAPALDLLEAAVQARDPAVGSVRTDPVWDPFRRDPRFLGALAQTGGSAP